jgi:DNA-binding NtrC family response regulator
MDQGTATLSPCHCSEILIIDDEAAVGLLFQILLRRRGHTAHVAQNVAQFSQILENHTDSISLLIIDWHLDGISGLEIVNHCRKKNPKLKIIVTSGFLPDDLQGFLSSNDIGFLPKPFRSEQLYELVRLQQL